MQTASSHFEAELRKRIEAQMEHVRDVLCNPEAVKDYNFYMGYIGEYRALRQVLEVFCDEINTKINQR